MELMSTAATAFTVTVPLLAEGKAPYAQGHIRVSVRLTLIALCSKWRGQCGEIITACKVNVNRGGMGAAAPRINTFKQ